MVLVVLAALPAGAAVSISAPSAKSLGTAPVGTRTLSAQLGTVTVNASGLLAPSVTVTVTATVFKTGAGGVNETIGKTSILYWSGPATATSGLASSTPGQPTAAAAQDLSVARTAFSARGLALSVSLAWNPTLIVNVPESAVAGTYTGTITHSAA